MIVGKEIKETAKQSEEEAGLNYFNGWLCNITLTNGPGNAPLGIVTQLVADFRGT